VLDRIHVLEGRQLVLLNIDEVIRIIRESDEPKAALMARFALSDRQAEDILEIRLRQLARLEAIKIEQELSQLRGEQGTLEDILGNPATLRRTVIKEIEADAKQFGDERRTLIQAEKRVVAEVKVVDEPVTVVVSAKGWVRALKGHEVEAGALQFKSGDALYGTFACRSVDQLIVLGSNGRVYSTAVAGLPGGRGDGQPITTLIELEAGTQPAHYLAGPAAQTLLLSGSGGFGLLARVGDLVSRQKGGKAFLTLEAGETLLAPLTMPALALPAADGALVGPPGVVQAGEGAASAKTAQPPMLWCLSAAGRLLAFGVDELKLQASGGRGLTLLSLEDGDTLAALLLGPGAVLQISGLSRQGKPREQNIRGVNLAAFHSKRARKGKPLELGFKAVGLRWI
jgi:topoisomerase-4 subunit A